MYKRREKIKPILKSLRKGMFLGDAIHEAGLRDRVVFYTWRTKPAKFSKYWHLRLKRLYELAIIDSDDLRTAGVEKAFISKLLRGDGTCADYAFYLCNRAPDRWKHVQTISNANVMNVKFEDKEFRNQFFMASGQGQKPENRMPADGQ